MPTRKYDEMPVAKIREGAERRLGHTDNLMMVVVDFYDGPQERPDPFHSHLHEQVSYVAEGEVVVVIGGESPEGDPSETRAGPGDIFLVPSGRPHTIQLLTRHARLIDCFTPIRQDFISK